MWPIIQGMKKILFVSSLLTLLTSCNPVSNSVFSSSSFSSDASILGSSSSISISSGVSSNSSSISTSSGDSSTSSILSTLSQSSSSPIIPQENLFDFSKDISFSIIFSPEALDFIDQYQWHSNATYNDAYLPADVTITYDGQTYLYPDTGVRMKGNTSRDHVYERGVITNYVHYKLNFNATFDSELYSDSALLPFAHTWSNAERKARKNRNFLGYEKLDLKFIPRNEDYCIAREIYAYQVFHNAGIYAPNARLTTLTITDGSSSLSGDYELIEPYDKKFFTRRLGKTLNGGDLYKCVYNAMGKADFSRNNAVTKNGNSSTPNTGQRIPNGAIGVEDNYQGYVPIYQLKTNDDGENSDFSKMANFINTIWSVRYSTYGKTELEQVLDMDEFLKMSALSYLLGNFDDQRYNNNNFYLYFMPDTGKAIMLPYDFDWALGAGSQGEPLYHTGPVEDWTLDWSGANSLFKVTFLGDNNLSYNASEYQQQYLSYVQLYKDEVLSINAYESLLNDLHCSDSELSQVTSYMNQKRSVL